MSRVMACLLGMALAGLWVGPAASDDPKPLQLIHSPWIKVCVVGTCFVGAEVRTECAPVAGAMLVERSGDAKRTLRVTLPSHVNAERGVRIIIGQSEPISASYAGCTRGVCEADYEAGADLVDRLKQGPTLVLEAMNAASSPVRVSLSRSISPRHTTARRRSQRCVRCCTGRERK
jgi:invasion protein IalB